MKSDERSLLSAGELFPQLRFHTYLRILWHIHISCRHRVRQMLKSVSRDVCLTVSGQGASLYLFIPGTRILGYYTAGVLDLWLYTVCN